MSEALSHRLRSALGGRTRQEAANAAGVSLRTVAKVIAGEVPRRSTLVRLARALDVNEDWLIDGNGPMRHLAVGSTTPEGHVVTRGPDMAFQTSLGPVILETKYTPLFSTLDMDRAAMALRAAEKMFADAGARPSDRARVQAMATLYDALMSKLAEQEAAQTAAHEKQDVKQE